MKYIGLLAIGLLLVATSIPTLKGNISLIHWYNRRKVSEEDAPRYGKVMGIGTLIIGSSVTLTGILQMIFDWELIFWLTAIGVVAGMSIMLYGQFKYNRGIF